MSCQKLGTLTRIFLHLRIFMMFSLINFASPAIFILRISSQLHSMNLIFHWFTVEKHLKIYDNSKMKRWCQLIEHFNQQYQGYPRWERSFRKYQVGFLGIINFRQQKMIPIFKINHSFKNFRIQILQASKSNITYLILLSQFSPAKNKQKEI